MFADSFQPNEAYQAQIALEFRRLVSEYRFADEVNLDNLLVVFIDFSDEAKVRANWRAEKEVTAKIKNGYPVVWDVISMFSSLVVFYFSDADITANEKNGVSEAITDTYY